MSRLTRTIRRLRASLSPPRAAEHISSTDREPSPPVRSASGGCFDQSGINTEWSHSINGKRITIPRIPILSPDARILTIGSCFAREIRAALRESGYDALPRYHSLEFDHERQRIGKMPEFENVNHYATFSIRQEIERALDGKRWSASDFIERPNKRVRGWQRLYQDPYRLNTFASDLDGLLQISHAISAKVEEGLAAADAYILTLGLTETWCRRDNGEPVCSAPLRRYDDDLFAALEFVPTGFAENLANMQAVVHRIRSAFPQRPIIVTVSPVALSRTYTGQDIVVANMTSKATLRAVAAELCRHDPAIFYWPSFEFATYNDVYEADGRHVRQSSVREIVGAFIASASPEACPTQARA